MKLKGKLISNFASVVVATLIIFGVITYRTIEESSRNSADQIIRLHNTVLILKLENFLSKTTDEISFYMIPQITNFLTTQRVPQDFSKKVQGLVSQAKIIKNVFLYTSEENQLIPLLNDSQPQAVESKFVAQEQQKGYIFWGDNSNLYLVSPMTKIFHNNCLVYEIDKGAFENLAKSLLEIDKSLLFISKNGIPLIPPVHQALEKSFNYQDLKLSTLSEDKEFDNFKNLGRIYRSPQNLFGASLTYLVPNSFYYSNLISLKNRVITALLIISWCSIWVILILAHKITTPLRRLTMLTKDIISFDYSSSLQFKPSRDEIGDLAINFEKMRKKLKNYVSKDQLTNVYNRRFLTHVFELALLKAIRHKEILSCIMLDIDYFKKVNDKYGHQAGDKVLVEIGKILLEHTRDYDTPARYGGEEFILVLPGTDLHSATDIAERIRRSTQEKVIFFEKHRINCTVSLGLSLFDSNKANSTEKIIQNADAALYRAKREGRNRTVVYDSKWT